MAEQPPKVKMTLAGRVALVTGGAKRIGRAVALQLAQDGADVALHYRGSDGAAQEVTSEIERLGRTAVAIDRKSTRLNSSHLVISYAVFCLKKKKKKKAST